jgi:hypothetical protein
MKTSTKAALYSSLIFPGAGYFLVNCKIRGILATSATAICFIGLFLEFFQRAQTITHKIVSGEIPYDVLVIAQHVRAMIYSFNTAQVIWLASTIGIIWVLSTIDAYRLGRSLD